MTERALGHSFTWWIAEVVNVYDPDQSGRVQIRVFGYHDDVSNIPDSDLPWAMPLQPVTSAAYGKIGTAPLGLVKGSKVTGYWADVDHQYPIIIGSFGKAGDFIEGSTSDGIPQVNTAFGSIPPSAQNYSPPPFVNMFSILNPERMLVTDINSGNKNPSTLTYKDGVEVRKELDKRLKQSETPTVSSAPPGGHVLDTIYQVDPNNKSASLPNMVANFLNIKNMIGMTSSAGQTNMFGAVIGGTLGSLGSVFGAGNVLKLFGGALGGLSGVNPIIAGALGIGLVSFIKSTASNNGQSTAYKPPAANVIGKNTPKPPANFIVINPPNLYVQQYYSIQNDPFPGYIQWKGPNGDFVYTLRNGQPNYASAQSHVQGDTIASMTSGFAPSFNSGLLSPNTLIGLLGGGLSSMNANSLTKILGSGVNALSLLGLAKNLLGGGLGGAIDGTVNSHLPQSVLNGSVQNTMGSYTQQQAMLQQKKKNMMAALEGTNIDPTKLSSNQIAILSSGNVDASAALVKQLGG
jgi:hypothetical protein